jgi:hypothetical protein
VSLDFGDAEKKGKKRKEGEMKRRESENVMDDSLKGVRKRHQSPAKLAQAPRLNPDSGSRRYEQSIIRHCNY